MVDQRVLGASPNPQDFLRHRLGKSFELTRLLRLNESATQNGTRLGGDTAWLGMALPMGSHRVRLELYSGRSFCLPFLIRLDQLVKDRDELPRSTQAFLQAVHQWI